MRFLGSLLSPTISQPGKRKSIKDVEPHQTDNHRSQTKRRMPKQHLSSSSPEVPTKRRHLGLLVTDRARVREQSLLMRSLPSHLPAAKYLDPRDIGQSCGGSNLNVVPDLEVTPRLPCKAADLHARVRGRESNNHSYPVVIFDAPPPLDRGAIPLPYKLLIHLLLFFRGWGGAAEANRDRAEKPLSASPAQEREEDTSLARTMVVCSLSSEFDRKVQFRRWTVSQP